MTRSRSARRRTIPAVIMAPIALLALTGCGQKAADPGQVGVVIDGYFMWPTDPVITGCIQPETSQWEPFNDVYRYPARQISWDATGGTGSERDPYIVVSNRDAPTELTVPVTVTMNLTTDCELLSNFHRELGTRGSGAWLDENGNVTEGWVALLDYVVGQPLEVTLTRIAQRYPWQDIWNDDAVRIEFEQTLQEELPERMKSRSGGEEYFTEIQVTVGKPDPVNPELVAAIAAGEARTAEANSERLAAEAEIATAEAETRVAQERALQQQAQIAGYPTVEDYLRALLIEQGGNPYQPTWVYPGVPQN